MPWWNSIVRIQHATSGVVLYGTGVFVEKDLVLTAAHTLQPRGFGGVPSADDMTVFVGDDELSVSAYVIHQRWSARRDLNTDMALLRVDAETDLGLAVRMTAVDDQSSRHVGLLGYPGGSEQSRYQTGIVTVVPDSGFASLFSDSFTVAHGVSGGPFLAIGESSLVEVVGIATWDQDEAIGAGFKGIPICSVTFSVIRSQI